MNSNNRRRFRNPINNRLRKNNYRRNNNRVRNRANLNRNLPINNNLTRRNNRTFNNRRPRRRNINKNKNKNNEIRLQREVNKLTNKIDNMSIKATNLIVPKKEIRSDKLISPYNMARRGQYVPIYEIKEKVLNMSVYTKLVVSLEGTTDEINYYMLFFPYSINFKANLFDVYTYKVTVTGGAADTYKNIWFLADNLTQPGSGPTISYKETAPSGIIGNWKLIGTTIKIYNVANMLNKGGDFSIIKIQSNELRPYFVFHGNDPEVDQKGKTAEFMLKDYSQAPRNNFSANETAFIDEYNVSEGTNIFNSPFEYMGCKYTSANYKQATYSNDMVGNNVTYMFHTKGMVSPQTYIFEVWNVFSVIPAPEAGLGNLGTISKRCFTKEVVENIKTRPNMYKANK